MIFSKKFHLLLLSFFIATHVPLRCANDDNNNNITPENLFASAVVLACIAGCWWLFGDTPSQQPSAKEQTDMEKAIKASLADLKNWQEQHPYELRIDKEARDHQQALYNSLAELKNIRKKQQKERQLRKETQHDRAFEPSAPTYDQVHAAPSAPDFADLPQEDEFQPGMGRG